ncbi:hypothetical protein ABZP36_025969 [Zizania latifolia]
MRVLRRAGNPLRVPLYLLPAGLLLLRLLNGGSKWVGECQGGLLLLLLLLTTPWATIDNMEMGIALLASSIGS